ncbi:hypothetical protein BSL78_25829 [Apostichopus japonicus]|uniref:Nuclear pore complex protein n=1 Tax=Stichopus japonicus TaxID=307972 RepID=A0A2G8JNM7_STIJA|nr:hypothetical protein BSL78_25829 [Apostichopus japonicus]
MTTASTGLSVNLLLAIPVLDPLDIHPCATTASGQSTSGGVSFGGAFGLGGKPNPEAAKINPFGVAASTAGGSGLFGGTTTLFGGQGPKAFGSPTSSGGGGFGGSGSFSTNAGGVVAGGFGSASQTSTASSAFGGGPSFGGAPAFGGKPSFGSPSGFGTGAAFSNPLGQSTFGASPPSGSVFGASSSTMPNTPSAGFGGFASQNTPVWWNSVQQSPAFGTGGGGGGFGAAQTGGAFGGNTGFGGVGSYGIFKTSGSQDFQVLKEVDSGTTIRTHLSKILILFYFLQLWSWFILSIQKLKTDELEDIPQELCGRCEQDCEQLSRRRKDEFFLQAAKQGRGNLVRGEVPANSLVRLGTLSGGGVAANSLGRLGILVREEVAAKSFCTITQPGLELS